MSDFGPSGGFARHEAKSGEQGEGQSLREKLSRDRPGSNLCGFCGGEGRIPTPAGLFSGFRGCCPKLVWAAALAVELCGFCCADARTAYSHRLVRCFQWMQSSRSRLKSWQWDCADSVVVMHELPTPAVQFGGFRTRQMCRTGLDCGIPRILWCFACIGYSHSGSYPFTTYSPHPFGFRISVPVEKRRIKCPEWSRFLTSDSGNKRADYRALNRVN